ncbi:MAG: hypothetical protein M0P57_03665 [Syntrophales bacterium]|nr:hypothetical protein [Syntrophales bacterium]MDY0045295.1 hypothetical protein [Syntrophales bacterium]
MLKIGTTSDGFEKDLISYQAYSDENLNATYDSERMAEDGPIYENYGDASSTAENSRRKIFKIAAVFAVFAFIAMAFPHAGELFFSYKSASALKTAKIFVIKNPEIAAQTGDNRRLRLVRRRFVQLTDEKKNAQFGFRVKGTAGTADVVVYLENKDDSWKIMSAFYKDGKGTVRRLPVK